jgi:hypothetical protein
VVPVAEPARSRHPRGASEAMQRRPSLACARPVHASGACTTRSRSYALAPLATAASLKGDHAGPHGFWAPRRHHRPDRRDCTPEQVHR